MSEKEFTAAELEQIEKTREQLLVLVRTLGVLGKGKTLDGRPFNLEEPDENR